MQIKKQECEIKIKNLDIVGVNFLARSFFIKQLFIGSSNKSNSVDMKVLNEINLEIKHGEKIGFIGRNGCGKSSLIKAITGIYPPQKGSVKVTGKIAAIVEMGLGFDADMTGRQNIKLGLLYGNRLDEYNKELEDEIVKFSGLEDYIDVPFKYYSSGMQAKLAFSVSVFQDSDILILDEVFAAGDSQFIKKSSSMIKKKFSDSAISIMVSHSDDIIRDNCTRCILLDGGRIIADGSTEDIMKEYNKYN